MRANREGTYDPIQELTGSGGEEARHNKKEDWW